LRCKAIQLIAHSALRNQASVEQVFAKLISRYFGNSAMKSRFGMLVFASMLWCSGPTAGADERAQLDLGPQRMLRFTKAEPVVFKGDLLENAPDASMARFCVAGLKLNSENPRPRC
jgi:hypothetical protein